jgi:hypothetical protein
MNIELPDGTILQDIPEGTTKQQIAEKLKANGRDVPDEWMQEPKRRSPLQMGVDFMRGVPGALGAAAVNIPIAGLGIAKGVASEVMSGDFGRGKAEQVARDFSREHSYEPSDYAQDTMRNVGGFLQSLGLDKLAGMNPSEGMALATPSAGAFRQAGQTAMRPVEAARTALADVGKKPMVGMGAAMTDIEAMRQARAQQLPVPIRLTKGQISRDFAQQQFEREAAKSPRVGGPLRERFAEQNEKILQNFDAWLDQTGAEAPSLRATGEVVTQAVADKAKSVKGKVTAAYSAARKSGDMEEKIDISPLKQFLDSHEAESVNAGVISAASSKVGKLAKDGTLSINDLEELRKMVGDLGGKDATNGLFAGKIKEQIDALTEGKGGDLYKAARAMHREYAKEFKNVGVVDKLLRNKPGTTDRAVAYEDVFQHSVLSGSTDDLRAIRKTLQTGGEKGVQAWKELQGATIQHLKDQITQSVALDQLGNRVVSPAKLDRLVNSLDKEGKLDILFGKQGAEQLREMNALAKDVLTSPTGSVNTSNTASILLGALDAIGMFHGVPAPVATIGHQTAKYIGARKQAARVREALSPDGSISLKELADMAKRGQ